MLIIRSKSVFKYEEMLEKRDLYDKMRVTKYFGAG
jgi:hypothetical protein